MDWLLLGCSPRAPPSDFEVPTGYLANHFFLGRLRPRHDAARLLNDWGYSGMKTWTILSTGLLLLTVIPASAVCDFCNPTIRLNQSVSECFLEQAPEILERLRAEGRGFVLVDLTSCVATKTRGLPKAGDPAVAEPIDTSFVADESALLCIEAEIKRLEGSLDPSVQLDLAQCP